MDIKEKMAGRIKDLREERCLTQKDLAYSSNLDRSYIADVERGMRNISIVNIEKIAKALNISIQKLFTDPRFNTND